VPSRGDTTVPSGGDTTVPSGGETAVPSGGETAVPSGGETAVPSGGETTVTGLEADAVLHIPICGPLHPQPLSDALLAIASAYEALVVHERIADEAVRHLFNLGDVDFVMPRERGEDWQTVLKWHKREGDPIAFGEAIVEISPGYGGPRAVFSPAVGTIARIHVDEGAVVPPGALLAKISTNWEYESLSAILATSGVRIGVPPGRALSIVRMEFGSVGSTALQGAAGPLETFRRYRNDRDERRKDKEWREDLEREHMEADIELKRAEARKLKAEARRTQSDTFTAQFSSLERMLGLAAAREWAARELATTQPIIDKLVGPAEGALQLTEGTDE
jgi:hypothetical protein